METKLADLIARCQSETTRYLQQESYDQQPCWEIWRRAIAEKDGEAWEAVMRQYDVLVRRWLRNRLNTIPRLRQEEDFLLNASFIKFYRFVDGEKLKSFNTLAALLRYLQMCCYTVITDEQRDYQARSGDVSLEGSLQISSDDNAEDAAHNSPLARLSANEDVEGDVLAGLQRLHFWEKIKQIVPDQTDQLLLYLDFVLDVPPREITKLYPNRFATVEDVYKRRRNVLWRMRHSQELQQYQF